MPRCLKSQWQSCCVLSLECMPVSVVKQLVPQTRIETIVRTVCFWPSTQVIHNKQLGTKEENGKFPLLQGPLLRIFMREVVLGQQN